MSFISYAQNFEDVMLWRALQAVSNGFYVDIGAWSPDTDSVTKAFSERGWRGINVEPNPVYFAELEARRPRDINLRIAIGEKAGRTNMTFFEGSGLSTADSSFAQGHIAAGFVSSVDSVEMKTLAELWRDHIPPSQPVHFLKVDVEGFERAALAGNDWATNRPWVVVVEATLPLTQIESHADWEPILLEAHYTHCYSDGLNRYYLAEEHAELIGAFRFPPNVFDRFVSAQVAAMAENAKAIESRGQADRSAYRTQVGRIEHELEQARQAAKVAESRKQDAERLQAEARRAADAQLAEVSAAVNDANHRAAIATQHHQAVLTSTTWRLMSPVRRLAALLPQSARAQARRAMKAGWWALTPWQLPKRLRFMQTRRVAGGIGLVAPTAVLPAPFVEVKPPSTGQYAEWIATGETCSADVEFASEGRPIVSFLVWGNVSSPGLSRTLGSVQNQRCAAWELVLCDSPSGDTGIALGEHAGLVASETRVKLASSESIGRAACLAAAAQVATGRYVAVLDCGDLLAPSALNEVASLLLRVPEADVIYSDEDVLSAEQVREQPRFKPGWSPDLLYAFNYFGRLTLLSRSLVQEVGGFRGEAGDAVEWDINLRASDSAQMIERIPKVLCHRWRDAASDRAEPGTPQAAAHRAAIERYWKDKGFVATADTASDGTQHVAWPLDDQSPLVSIIVPTKNKPSLLRMCMDGLLLGTDYPNMEIVVVDTGSDDPETLRIYRDLSNSRPEVRIVYFRKAFNYSAACNYGASCAKGEMLLFLNNDIEVISRDWLQELVRFAMRPGVGVVGTKLIYPSLELQHAGVAIGIHLAALMYRSAGGRGWGVFGSPDHPRNWLSIMGACQLVRRNVFDQIGGFDEAYEIAMSDVALCLQAWRVGYRTAYAPRACLVHHEGATRGNTNPVQDIRRLADDIRAIGIDEDPYLHPELDGHRAIPSLRLHGAPSVREILKVRIREDGSPEAHSRTLDFTNEGACIHVTGLNRQQVLWAPQPAHKVADKWSAARWCLDLLRSRRDLRTRFPRALSDGLDGAFFVWLRTEGSASLGLSPTCMRAMEDLFAQDIAAEARQIFLFRSDVRALMPHGLTPPGQLELFRWFMQHGRGETGLRLEQIWWLFWQASEDPAAELIKAYEFTPAWQRLYPDALTVFGCRAFAAWFAGTYRINAPWVEPAQWPLTMSPAQQIRIAYLAREHWQTSFPLAMQERGQAEALIRWLQVEGGAEDAEQQRWIATLDASSVVSELVGLGVNVIGHFCYPSGLRVSVEALVGGLNSAGVATSLRDLRTDKKDDPNHVGFAGAELYDVTVIHTQPEPFFREAYERADLTQRLPRTYRVAYWYWEFDSIPDFWVAHAETVDEVWAATEFVAKGLRDRLSLPIRTLFPGVQLGAYQRRKRAYFGLEEEPFTFLFTFHMMSIMERKNPLGLIRAFKTAFSPDENVQLVLKTSFGDRHPAQIEELREAAAGSRIKIIDQVYSPDEVLSLMDACDAYVSLHRSEGLGLTLAEAMLMGKPVIATNYSGNVDFMDETNSLLVPYRLVKLGRPIPPYDADSEWAEPSTAHAAQCMRRVFDDQPWARELGARAKVSAEANLSLESAGRRVAKRLEEIRKRPGR